MRPRCSRPTTRDDASSAAAMRQVEPAPQGSLDDARGSAARSSKGVGSSRSHAEEGLEDLADRLAEAFGGVLHARGLRAESRSPRAPRGARGRGRACAPARTRARTSRDAEQEQITRAVERALRARPARGSASRRARRSAPSPRRPAAARHRVDQRDDTATGKQPEQDAARGEPQQADALRGGPRRALARASPRAAGRGRSRRRTSPSRSRASAATSATPAATTGTSMLRYGLAARAVNRKLCSSSHSETKPLDGGSPALASTPTSVVPRDPGHEAHQAAELAEAALVRWHAARRRCRGRAGS